MYIVKSSLFLFSSSMEAVCMYDFEASGEDELSFKKGQIIKVHVYMY